MSNNGLSHLISVPLPPTPIEDLPFLLTPEDWLKLHSPLKTAIKYGFTPEELGYIPEEYGFTPEELGYIPEEYGFTPEEFCENEGFTPKEFHIFLLYP